MSAVITAALGMVKTERPGVELRRTYEAYLEALDRRDGEGRPLPEWDELGPREKRAWRAVTFAVQRRGDRAEALLGLLRAERDAQASHIQSLGAQVRYLGTVLGQDALEAEGTLQELEALRETRRRKPTPAPTTPPLVSQPATDEVAKLKARIRVLETSINGPGGYVEVQDLTTIILASALDGLPEADEDLPHPRPARRAAAAIARLRNQPPPVLAANDDAPRLVTVKVTAVAPDEEGGGLYLAVERGLHEVHQGDTVRVQGSDAVAEVTSVEPTAELPVFVGFPGATFNPKTGDTLELLPKAGDELPALIA